MKNVHAWLKSLPEPCSVRVDGEHVLRITKSPRRFTIADDALRDLGWDVLEALDGKGNIMRVLKASELGAVAPTSTQSAGELQVFAKLLSEAYKQGAADHSDAYKEAFKYMKDLVDITSKRLTAIERMLSQRIRDDVNAAEDAREQAEENAGAGGLGGIMATVTQLNQAKDLIGSIVPPKAAK